MKNIRQSRNKGVQKGHSQKESKVLQQDQELKCQTFSIKPKVFTDKDFQIYQNKSQECFDSFKIKIKLLDSPPQDLSPFCIRITPCAEDKVPPENFIEETTESQNCNLSFFQYKLKDDTENGLQRSWKNFVEFTKARYQNQERNKRVNLKVCDLKQVLAYCEKKEIISKGSYKRFFLNYDSLMQKNFLSLEKKEIVNLQVKKCLFILLDHRYFCQALIANFPEEFEMEGKPITFQPLATQYLNYIYGFTFPQYESYWEEFNKVHQRFWMPKKDQQLKGLKIEINLKNNEGEIDYICTRGRKLRTRIVEY